MQRFFYQTYYPNVFKFCRLVYAMVIDKIKISSFSIKTLLEFFTVCVESYESTNTKRNEKLSKYFLHSTVYSRHDGMPLTKGEILEIS